MWSGSFSIKSPCMYISLMVRPVPPAALLVESVCNKGGGEQAKAVWWKHGWQCWSWVCVDGCGLVFAAEPAVFGVCADCGRLSPPRQIPVFVCFLPSLRAPLSMGAARWPTSWGSATAVTPSVPQPLGTMCLFQNHSATEPSSVWVLGSNDWSGRIRHNLLWRFTKGLGWHKVLDLCEKSSLLSLFFLSLF